jgi:hypothetical protein
LKASGSEKNALVVTGNRHYEFAVVASELEGASHCGLLADVEDVWHASGAAWIRG